MRVKITSHGSIKKLDNYAWSRDQQIRRHMRPELPSSIGHSLVWLGMHSQHASLAEQVADTLLCVDPVQRSGSLDCSQCALPFFLRYYARCITGQSVRMDGRPQQSITVSEDNLFIIGPVMYLQSQSCLIYS